MLKSIFKSSCIALLFFISLHSAHASSAKNGTGKGTGDTCDWIFSGTTDGLFKMPEADQAFEDLKVQQETHSLRELLSLDPKQNLAVQKPMIAMNAAQRLLTLTYAHGVKKVQLPWMGGREISYFPLFSDGLDVVQGVRVVGNYDVVERFIGLIEAQARGDRSGSSPILLTGPPGTGKSEFLKVIRKSYERMTSSLNSPYAVYTFEWVNLHEIPTIAEYAFRTPDGGSLPRMAPMYDSPITLLPFEIQSQILNLAAPTVRELTHGLDPDPHREPDPQSAFLRDQILMYYEHKVGRQLSTVEKINVLDRHVKIKRVVFGKLAGSLPTIEYQGNDIPIANLFFAPDVVNKLEKGARHVMSWQLTGKMPGGHGNAILFDEIFRNSAEFLNILLGVIESRVFDIGGAPRVAFDSVIMAATNEANVNELKKDPKAKAQLDRFQKVSMPYGTRPHEIAETMLYMKKEGLEIKPLGEAEPSSTPVTHQDVFPLPELHQKVQGPDGRYSLVYKNGSKAVTIAPHAVMLLSEITAATHFILSIKGFEQTLGNYRMAMSPTFRDEIQRLLYLEGFSSLSDPEIQELHEILKSVEEGHTGLSTRNAGRWFTNALAEAGRPENGYTLTPDLVLSVFKRMLHEKEMGAASIDEEANWLRLAETVSQSILLPRLKEDFSKALTMNSSNVDATYRDVLEELKALEVDDRATKVKQGARQRDINTERLNKIKKIYLANEGRPLVTGKILSVLYDAGNGHGQVKERRCEELYRAIVQYYADLQSQMVSYADLLEAITGGEGNDDKKRHADNFMLGMARLGYNEFSARMALDVVSRMTTTQQSQGGAR